MEKLFPLYVALEWRKNVEKNQYRSHGFSLSGCALCEYAKEILCCVGLCQKGKHAGKENKPEDESSIATLFPMISILKMRIIISFYFFSSIVLVSFKVNLRGELLNHFA